MPGYDPEKEEKQPASEWFIKTFGPFHLQERFLYYGVGGLLDPKNYTLEPYLLSGGGSAAFWTWDKSRWGAFGRGFMQSQAIAFFGVGLLGAIFDPLGRDDDAGIDEIIGDVYDWRDTYELKSGQHNRDWGLGNNLRIGTY